MTFHRWCLDFLTEIEGAAPRPDDKRCRQAVFRAFGNPTPDQRAALGSLDGRFVDDEIVHVIKHNGLTSREAYFGFNRQGRRVGLKQAQRDVIWTIHLLADQYLAQGRLVRWSDLPLRALAAIERRSDPSLYRAVVVDEAQDYSPAMMRLARRRRNVDSLRRPRSGDLRSRFPLDATRAAPGRR